MGHLATYSLLIDKNIHFLFPGENVKRLFIIFRGEIPIKSKINKENHGGISRRFRREFSPGDMEEALYLSPKVINNYLRFCGENEYTPECH